MNLRTWEVLGKFERPLLTLYGDSDPGTAGWERVFQERVPGARDQRHEVFADTGHFIQEDRGPEIAARIVGLVDPVLLPRLEARFAGACKDAWFRDAVDPAAEGSERRRLERHDSAGWVRAQAPRCRG